MSQWQGDLQPCHSDRVVYSCHSDRVVHLPNHLHIHPVIRLTVSHPPNTHTQARIVKNRDAPPPQTPHVFTNTHAAKHEHKPKAHSQGGWFFHVVCVFSAVPRDAAALSSSPPQGGSSASPGTRTLSPSHTSWTPHAAACPPPPGHGLSENNTLCSAPHIFTRGQFYTNKSAPHTTHIHRQQLTPKKVILIFTVLPFYSNILWPLLHCHWKDKDVTPSITCRRRKTRTSHHQSHTGQEEKDRALKNHSWKDKKSSRPSSIRSEMSARWDGAHTGFSKHTDTILS